MTFLAFTSMTTTGNSIISYNKVIISMGYVKSEVFGFVFTLAFKVIDTNIVKRGFIDDFITSFFCVDDLTEVLWW